jgi:hypothetical protein
MVLIQKATIVPVALWKSCLWWAHVISAGKSFYRIMFVFEIKSSQSSDNLHLLCVIIDPINQTMASCTIVQLIAQTGKPLSLLAYEWTCPLLSCWLTFGRDGRLDLLKSGREWCQLTSCSRFSRLETHAVNLLQGPKSFQVVCFKTVSNGCYF